MAANLDVVRNESSLICTIRNPESRNSLGPEIYAPFHSALNLAESDDSIRTVVLTGAGGTFSAGGNLNRLRESRSLPPEHQAASIEQLHTLTRAISNCSKPVIAAVEGAAAGAGLSIALGCDLIIAGRSAKFVMAYVKVGLSPDGGGSWFAARQLPRQTALEIMLLGEPWTATRLAELGIVNRVVDDGTSVESALEIGQRIERLSAHAISRIKVLVGRASSDTLEEHLDLEKTSFVHCLHHPDAGEAIDAFLAKRPPNFGPRNS